MSLVTTAPTAAEVAEYRAEYPATGCMVHLYLDGTAKPTTWARFVLAETFLGLAGLITQEGQTKHGARRVSFDLADADDLLDAIGDLEAGYIVPVTKGQATTFAALYNDVRKAVAPARIAQGIANAWAR